MSGISHVLSWRRLSVVCLGEVGPLVGLECVRASSWRGLGDGVEGHAL
jgi:hypothetical protein